MDGKTILAFVTWGSKFAACSPFEEVTTQVSCKVRIIAPSDPPFTPTVQAVDDLQNVSLPSACSRGSTGE